MNNILIQFVTIISKLIVTQCNRVSFKKVITPLMSNSKAIFLTIKLTVVRIINNHRISLTGKMPTVKMMIILAEKIQLFKKAVSVSGKIFILRTVTTFMASKISLKIHNNLIPQNLCAKNKFDKQTCKSTAT